MNTPFRITCSNPQCKHSFNIHLKISESIKSDQCPQCGTSNNISLSSGIHIGIRLLIKAKAYFHEEKDYNMSILFSALALDCYLSNLYYKWRHIHKLQECIKENGKNYPNDLDEKINDELNRMNGFIKKMKKISNILYPGGIVKYIKGKSELAEEIVKGSNHIKIDSFIEDIQKELMRKRNNIVHVGGKEYSENEAAFCHNYAFFTIGILGQMDEEKSKNE